MVATSYETRNKATIIERASKVEGIKGSPLPEKIIQKLGTLEKDYPEYSFVIGSAHTLSRNKAFFRSNYSSLKFYDRNGSEFDFLDRNAKATKYNSLFIGISFVEATKEAFVFAYIPGDGAR